jgi:hypothetical protein
MRNIAAAKPKGMVIADAAPTINKVFSSSGPTPPKELSSEGVLHKNLREI